MLKEVAFEGKICNMAFSEFCSCLQTSAKKILVCIGLSSIIGFTQTNEIFIFLSKITYIILRCEFCLKCKNGEIDEKRYNSATLAMKIVVIS